MANRRTHEFVVSVAIPEGVTTGDMTAYIEQAVRTWAGSKSPDDPIYDLDRASVKVRHVRKAAKPRKGG